MPFPSPLSAHLADLERRDVEPLDLRPVPRPTGIVGDWWDQVDATLIGWASTFRDEFDVAEVADRVASLKADRAGLWLIGENEDLLAALRGDPREYLATRWLSSSRCGTHKFRVNTWIMAWRKMAEDAGKPVRRAH